MAKDCLKFETTVSFDVAIFYVREFFDAILVLV